MIRILFAVLLAWGAFLSEPSVAAATLPEPSGPVLLTVTGRIAQTNAPGEARFDRAMLEALGLRGLRTSTRFTDGVRAFEGVGLRAVLDRVGARGTQLEVRALNEYMVRLPLADLVFEPLLAMRMDGEPLLPRNKGPIWIVYPRDEYRALQDERYDARWVWQVNRLHVE
jgi:hypothetical protein